MKLDLELNKVEEKPEVIPTLYDIHKSFNVIKVKNHDGIKGEFQSRMVIFTNFVLGNKSIVLTGPRGCLTEDAVIFTNKGLLTIKEIRNNIDKYMDDLEVVSFNNKEFVFSPVNVLWENGKQKVYEVITRSGRKLKCTDNHPFYDSMKWVTMKGGLSKGDIISLSNEKYLSHKGMYKPSRETLSKITKYVVGLKEIVEQPLYYDQIKEIKECGFEETYDLLVEGNHNYIANGILVHNSGKSLLMKTVCTYAKKPGEVSKASERADYRDTDLNTYSHFVIPEINKISDSFLEVLKDIGEGEKSTYKVLDAFKMPTTYTIYPKPFISSVADENQSKLGDELLSRITTIRTNASLEQNKAVISYKLARAQNPFIKKGVSQAEVKSFQKYVKSLPSIKDFTFIYLPGESVIKAIPPFFTDSRRDTDKYLENTYGISLFHLHDRMIIERGKKKLFLITPADAWYNHVIFNDVLVQSSLKCSGIEKIILKLLAALVDDDGKYISLSPKEIHVALVEKGFTPNLPTIKKYCNNLYNNGYLIRDEEKKPYRYESSGFLKDFVAHIDWKEIVEECKKAVIKQFKQEIVDEYIKRYCTNPILVKNPFTGEEINLFEFKEEVFADKEMIKNIKTEKVKEKSSENLNSFKAKIKLPNIDVEDISEQVTEDLINEHDEDDKHDKKDIKFPIERFMEMYGKENSGEVDATYVESYYGEEQVKKMLEQGELFEVKNGRYKLLK